MLSVGQSQAAKVKAETSDPLGKKSHIQQDGEGRTQSFSIAFATTWSCFIFIFCSFLRRVAFQHQQVFKGAFDKKHQLQTVIIRESLQYFIRRVSLNQLDSKIFEHTKFDQLWKRLTTDFHESLFSSR